MKPQMETLPSSTSAINFLNLQDIDLGSDMDIPESFDWREKGVNDTVESQGYVGLVGPSLL